MSDDDQLRRARAGRGACGGGVRTVSDAVASRVRWIVGIVTGFLFGALVRGGQESAETHPWLTIALCIGAAVLLGVDYLVLDDDGDVHG